MDFFKKSQELPFSFTELIRRYSTYLKIYDLLIIFALIVGGIVYEQLKLLVENELLPLVTIFSVDNDDPVRVESVPKGWKLIGNGNYAAVFVHPKFKSYVVKIYASNRLGINQEIEVYRRLGEYPSFAKLYAYGERYLILKRLEGITLYNAIHKGIFIPEQVIKDVDDALDYARTIGLNPYDVHGKNIVMHEGRGAVVDVSDFTKTGEDPKWRDLRKAYYKLYQPIYRKFCIPVPYFLLDVLRKGYRLYRKTKRKIN
jgi:hypothetical protein